ncbi:MAG: LPS export ABC transporter periplasmic protein LptC, partial [Pseudohongiellaceae bacterium]
MRLHLAYIIMLSAVILYLLLTASDENVAEITDSEIALSQDYDYYMTGIDATHFSLQGEPEYRLQAQRLTHYPDPDYTMIDAPGFVIFQAQNTP